MKRVIFKSLEQLLTTCFIIAGLIVVVLCAIIGVLQQWNYVNVAILCIVVAIILALGFSYTYSRTIVAFKRGSMHLEAVSNNDYCQYAKPAFNSGKVVEFHHDLENLSAHLQSLKSRYDQHVFLVYQLIEQLDSPILVFDQNPQLTYANSAFNELFPQPWQIFRHSSPGLLGLELVDNVWRFKDSKEAERWEIRHSEFIDKGKNHLLMVFINVESVLRQSQLSAWQQLIRVLGHEIHNSLTPVSTLAQGLAIKSGDEREKQALTVITERCKHLQDFVSRYASITKPFQLSCQLINTNTIAQRLQKLMTTVELEIEINTPHFWADPTFIEQVLINLIKNASEASNNGDKITLVFSDNNHASVIKVIDNGQGITNFDNLFVPLYSTKQGGQGIGLCFCRNIVDHHNGTITLTNNTDTSGVTATVSLPLRENT